MTSDIPQDILDAVARLGAAHAQRRHDLGLDRPETFRPASHPKNPDAHNPVTGKSRLGGHTQ